MTDSVGPTPHFRNVPHMTAMGYIMIAALALLFLPLLPLVAIIWLLAGGRSTGPEEPGAA